MIVQLLIFDLDLIVTLAFKIGQPPLKKLIWS